MGKKKRSPDNGEDEELVEYANNNEIVDDGEDTDGIESIDDEMLTVEDEYAQVEVIDDEKEESELMESCYTGRATRSELDQFITDWCPYKRWGPDPKWEMNKDAQWERFRVYMREPLNERNQELIIKELIPLAKKIILAKARTFISHKNADDYLQEAILAVLQDLQRYDVNRIPPLNFFYERILGAVVRYNSTELGSTRYHEKIIKKVVDATKKFTSLGIPESQITDSMILSEFIIGNAVGTPSASAIVRARAMARNRGGGFLPIDEEHLGEYASDDNPVRAAEQRETAETVERLLQICTPVERDILMYLSASENESDKAESRKQLSEKYGMSTREINEIFSSAIEKIRSSTFFQNQYPEKVKAMDVFADCEVEIASFLKVNKKDERTFFFADEYEVEEAVDEKKPETTTE